MGKCAAFVARLVVVFDDLWARTELTLGPFALQQLGNFKEHLAM